MKQSAEPHPDQDPALWDGHVAAYEAVFEPLSDQFAAAALRLLGLAPGQSLLDCAAGSGGAALMAACQGLAVTAIDAAPAMVRRIAERSADLCVEAACIKAACMDAQALAFEDGRFDGAVSVFGLILCADPAAALRELARVTAAGGAIAVVTWSEPERYELAARLLRAAAEVRGTPPSPAALPPQLRFRERDSFARLFADAGLMLETIERVEAPLRAPSAAWLAARLDFAPGLAAMLDGFGADRAAIVERFRETLARERGEGDVALGAVGMVGLGKVCPPASRG